MQCSDFRDEYAAAVQETIKKISQQHGGKAENTPLEGLVQRFAQ